VPVGGITLQSDDPRAADVMELLAIHLAFAREVTPPDDVHALDIDDLDADDVSLFSARRNGQLLAIGALRHLDATHAEIKSMHTAAAARGEGAGRMMLDHLVETARRRSYSRVSLETGTMDAFAPARRGRLVSSGDGGPPGLPA
jgi:putative acetyltransferase